MAEDDDTFTERFFGWLGGEDEPEEPDDDEGSTDDDEEEEQPISVLPSRLAAAFETAGIDMKTGKAKKAPAKKAPAKKAPAKKAPVKDRKPPEGHWFYR